MASQIINDHILTIAPDLDVVSAAPPQCGVPTNEPCGICDQRSRHLPGCVGVLEGVLAQREMEDGRSLPEVRWDPIKPARHNGDNSDWW